MSGAKKFRELVSPGRLAELYQKHTDKEIAAQFEVSDVFVSKRRAEWGIKTLTERQRRDQEREGLSLDSLTPSILMDLYSRMGDAAIAKMYGCSKPAISSRRRKWGIKSISKSERATSSRELTGDQKALCIGTLMGDAFVSKSGWLKVFHTESQFEYLCEKHKRLFPISKPIRYDEKELDSGKICYSFGFRTRQHVWLRTLRGVFYPEGEKIFPREILESLSPISLAFWYFDDGHLDSNLPTFALGRISEEASGEVVKSLSKRFGLEFYVSPKSSESCQILALRASSTPSFFGLIQEYATKDMLHKIPRKYWPLGEVPHIKVGSDPIQFDKTLVDKGKAWDSLGEEGQSEYLEQVISFWRDRGFPHYSPRLDEISCLSKVTWEQVTDVKGDFKVRHVGQATCQAFAKHIWEGKSFGSTYSPREIFEKDELFGRALQMGLKYGRIPNAAGVRACLRSWKQSGVYNFRPAIAKVIVDRYCPPNGLVYDPCVGYGGRALGALLSGSAPNYWGCDVNREGLVSVREMCTWLSDFIPGVNDRVRLFHAAAEEFTMKSGVDLVLTSPPYWKRETYEESPHQSGIKYPTYEEWLTFFWEKVIRSCRDFLKEGGWAVFNVDDFEISGVRYELPKDTQDLCRRAGLSGPEIFKYKMPSLGGSNDNFEYVMAWCKTKISKESPSPKTLEREPVGLIRCQTCGKVSSLGEMVLGECPECYGKKEARIGTCEGCGKTFESNRSNTRYCGPNCYARFKRKEDRKVNPVKKTRTFTCTLCGSSWETKAKGRFKYCPSCKEKKDVETRMKVCQYRHCGESFLDTSKKNTMKFCCEEHRRREKLFRLGKVEDESYFQYQDTPDRKPKRKRTCIKCSSVFYLEASEKNNNTCPECREKARHKLCKRCGGEFFDESVRNNRKFCGGC